MTERSQSSTHAYMSEKSRLSERDQTPDAALLSWFVRRSGISSHPEELADTVLGHEQGMLGRVLQNPSVSEQYLGVSKEEVGFRQIINAVQQVVERSARESLKNVPVMENRPAFIAYLRTKMAYRNVEQFRLLSLNQRGILVNDTVQHEGTIDHTPVYPREVAKTALYHQAASVVLAHNHPSNHFEPSQSDIDMTKQVQESLEHFGIPVYDHLILAPSGHSSFLEKGFLGNRQKTLDTEKGEYPYPGLYSNTGPVHGLSPDRTPEMDAVAQRNLQPFLTDEKVARFVDDKALLSWLIWRFNISRNPSIIAKALLEEKGSLGALVQDPSSVRGVEAASGCEPLFMVIKEVGERVVRKQVDDRPALDNWEKVIGYLRNKESHGERQPVKPAGFAPQRILYLNRINRLISDEHMEVTPNVGQKLVRQVSVRALDINASAIIVIDDLPDRVDSPPPLISSEDIGLTRHLHEALDGIGIVLHDRIAISKKGYRSFKQLGLLEMKKS